MAQEYRYWKRKRQVIHFISLMVSTFLLLTSFFIDVVMYAKHIDANGVVDPEYESPTTIVVAIMFIIFIFALSCFIFDLIFFFNVKSRLRKKSGNNIEINIKNDDKTSNVALDDAERRFTNAGLAADINAQTGDLDIEYSYKITNFPNTKETLPLFLYILYKPFGFSLLLVLLFGAGINLLVSMDNPKGAILPIIISSLVVTLFVILVFFLLVLRANKNKKKSALSTKEIGIRIYPDHLEQYNVIVKDETEAEIRYKVPFSRMKHLETKKAFYCRSYNNGQVVALRLNKDEMPEEALILLKNKIKNR